MKFTAIGLLFLAVANSSAFAPSQPAKSRCVVEVTMRLDVGGDGLAIFIVLVPIFGLQQMRTSLSKRQNSFHCSIYLQALASIGGRKGREA
jgi:hypothetical protein